MYNGPGDIIHSDLAAYGQQSMISYYIEAVNVKSLHEDTPKSSFHCVDDTLASIFTEAKNPLTYQASHINHVMSA